MSARDVLALAAGALLRHRRRSGLSLLGVAIGVSAVVALTALGEGARRYVRGQFEALGTNVLGVLPGKTETTGGMPGLGGVPNDLTLDDAEALRRGLTAALHVAPVSIGNDTVSHRDRSREVVVLGSTREIREIRDLRVRAGDFLPELPWHRGAPVVVLGATLAAELFPGASPLGQVVRVGGWRMRVVGVLEAQGMHLGVDMDETAFVPVATCMAMFDRSSLFRITARLRANADPDAARRRCIEILAARHGEEDFTVVTQDAVLDALSGILGVLTAALGGIAAISLSVAGIGIMNVMLVSVAERTGEIGLLAAIGAEPRQILSLFLAEAVLLSSAGGALGLLVGWALVRALGVLWPAFPAAAPAWAVVAAGLVSVVVGVAFGVAPARRAMRLEPVAALERGR